MKVKIIKEINEEKLETKINKYIKGKDVIHVDTKPITTEVMINTLSTYEKIEYRKNEYMATIIYEG